MKTDSQWIATLGESYNKDFPLAMQIAEYEAKAAARATKAKPQKKTDSTDESLGRFIRTEVFDPLLKRIEELEAKLEGGLGYQGPWQSGTAYGRGMFVSHGGSMFHCESATCRKPGESSDWKLAVKRGRDARARP